MCFKMLASGRKQIYSIRKIQTTLNVMDSKMNIRRITSMVVIITMVLSAGSKVAAQDEIVFRGRVFKWVNPFPENIDLPPGVHHKTFFSPSMKHDVGYGIYLPPGYSSSTTISKRYPVVYYLHGGRPGSEARSIELTKFIHEAIVNGDIPPAIYVYVNGGILSHYNYAEYESMGEDSFIKELIPHVDANFRTITNRNGRALQGFSQGGRGTTRIMFKYPELFISAAPGGPGYAVEKLIFENDGVEFDTRSEEPLRFDFGKGNDAFTLAKSYSQSPGPKLRIAIWIGTKGFNYDATLEYMDYLETLDIPYQSFVAPGVGHNPFTLYEKIGIGLMNFHAEAFKQAE